MSNESHMQTSDYESSATYEYTEKARKRRLASAILGGVEIFVVGGGLNEALQGNHYNSLAAFVVAGAVFIVDRIVQGEEAYFRNLAANVNSQEQKNKSS